MLISNLLKVMVMLVLLVPTAQAVPWIRGVTGEPEQGQVLQLETGSLADLPTLRVFFCDNPVYDLAHTRVEQTVTYRGGWNGPIRIEANFTGFSDGQMVYVIPSNGDPASQAAAFGEPIVFGHPLISGASYSGGANSEMTIYGTGFTTQQGSAKIELANAADANSVSTWVEQTALAWSDNAIRFSLQQGALASTTEVYVYVTDDDGDRNILGFRTVPERPTVQSLNLDAGILTIAGNGFKDQGGSQIVHDDFEMGTAGGKISATPSTDWHDWIQGGVYTDEHSFSGSLSAYATTGDGDTTFDTCYYTFDPANAVFISYLLAYYSPDPANIDGVFKLSRINSNDPEATRYHGPGEAGLGHSGHGWPGSAQTWFNNGDTVPSAGWVPAFPSADRSWSRVETYKRDSTAGLTDGEVFFTIDGETVCDRTALTKAAGRTFQMSTTIMGLMAANMTRRLDIYIDDFYAATTLARVVIADNADYDQAQNFAIQSINSWTSQAIEVTVKPGAFEDIDGKYLIVIDRYGNPSTGYLIGSNPSNDGGVNDLGADAVTVVDATTTTDTGGEETDGGLHVDAIQDDQGHTDHSTSIDDVVVSDNAVADRITEDLARADNIEMTDIVAADQTPADQTAADLATGDRAVVDAQKDDQSQISIAEGCACNASSSLANNRMYWLALVFGLGRWRKFRINQVR